MVPLKQHHLPPGFTPDSVSLPVYQTVIAQNNQGVPTIYDDAPLPTPESHMVLVKTVAVSINPCDWKMPSRFPSPGARIGCDFAGTILSIGPDAARIRPDLQVGDRVCGGIHGSNPIDLPSGTFAEYITAHADLLLKLPKHISFAQGAVLGGSVFATLWIALYDSLGLAGTPDAPLEGEIPPVLVYGGSTSTGTASLQILRASGYKPVTTCSPHNFALVKEYGAEEAFDYNSPTCAADIKAYTKGRLRHVLDIITDLPSQAICYETFGRVGGKYTCLELPSEELHLRRTVKKEMIVGLAASGKEIALADGYERPANPRYRAESARFFQTVQQMLDAGRFKPHPAKVLSGRFEGILEGIEILRSKGTSGEKLVVFVDDSYNKFE
ncbi:Zinc-binding dehydrogenase [Aspergillus sclerotialis]|uniref:Zinc-binding dehydrogenase n=1 Tax=Aspergillus sclerotialis TaxID=2070753 RepID=A0A3A2ZWP9_9EURO|nr:Zinc-binding dehydrogenase [Aspergillus sclerotialis]